MPTPSKGLLEGDFSLAEFQRLIAERYAETDAARGTPGTWLWFVEEVGELSSALAARHTRGKTDPTTTANVAEEFADVLAWLCTLANINDVDLTEAVRHKYTGDNTPTGTK